MNTNCLVLLFSSCEELNIDHHEINNIPICTVGGVVDTHQGQVIGPSIGGSIADVKGQL